MRIIKKYVHFYFDSKETIAKNTTKIVKIYITCGFTITNTVFSLFWNILIQFERFSLR